MGYKPRYDAVLRHRIHLEEEVQREFSTAKNELLHQKEQLKQLRLYLQDILQDLSNKQTQGISADELNLYYQFIKKQYEQLKQQQNTLEQLNEVFENKREDLALATKEKKVVEKLQEKDRKAFFKVLDKREQDLLDEIAGNRKELH